MNIFNLPCTSCSNQLTETGSLLSTNLGPFVCCDVCRALYFVDVVTNFENKPVIIIQPTKFEQEQEFDIIRNALSRTPLKDYLPKEDEERQDWGNYLPNEKNINPHFDLKNVIEESVTPSDLIRKLKS